MKRRLLVATNNPDKLREIRQILSDINWEVLGLGDFPTYPEPNEDGDNITENAIIKAREAYRQTGILSLADDTGLEVDELNGAPGVKSARYAGENASYQDNVAKLLNELKSVEDDSRRARFRCVMALVGEGIQRTWEGIAEGVILSNPQGYNGFGYDPVFWSPELNMTFAEASAELKNEVSHRGRALRDLPNVLERIIRS